MRKKIGVVGVSLLLIFLFVGTGQADEPKLKGLDIDDINPALRLREAEINPVLKLERLDINDINPALRLREARINPALILKEAKIKLLKKLEATRINLGLEAKPIKPILEEARPKPRAKRIKPGPGCIYPPAPDEPTVPGEVVRGEKPNLSVSTYEPIADENRPLRLK